MIYLNKRYYYILKNNNYYGDDEVDGLYLFNQYILKKKLRYIMTIIIALLFFKLYSYFEKKIICPSLSKSLYFLR